MADSSVKNKNFDKILMMTLHVLDMRVKMAKLKLEAVVSYDADFLIRNQSSSARVSEGILEDSCDAPLSLAEVEKKLDSRQSAER